MGLKSAPKRSSRISKFFRMSVPERIEALRQRGLLVGNEVRLLATGGHGLTVPVADKMIENVIGVFGLPLGLGLNFLINGRDYVVPLVVEEPSIVAGLSGAARIARLGGGFSAESTDPVLIGQVQVVGAPDPEAARQQLLQEKEAILALASVLPSGLHATE